MTLTQIPRSVFTFWILIWDQDAEFHFTTQLNPF